jgi:hypothetical protein
MSFGLYPATIGGPSDASMWLKCDSTSERPKRMLRILVAFGNASSCKVGADITTTLNFINLK